MTTSIKEKLTTELREATETRIEALLTAYQTTIHESTRMELSKRINRLNGYYAERYGRPYIPEAQPPQVPFFVGSLDVDTVRRLHL